ncbi:hypothetical protein CSHISOI_07860 [Colletotrichum shisoi]|uniref:F-box domain-containing protein n=1 Tax=Colletotrichum shisoi TaxID=2078593 RepID=A0A5Q4BLZ7_9PEZI|nr:hypothetical protein CSHISOI_07860 [Colletotrichum shisoi]
MAKLTDLPPETLLTITSFIWSGLPAKKRLFDASISKKKHALAKSLNHEGISVINLASTCKYLHRVLAAEKYRFVSIPGCNSAQKLLSLLRLIRIRPEIGHHVQQLRLQLSVLPYGHTSVSYKQLRSLKAWAATIGLTIADETWVDAIKYDNGMNLSLNKAMEYEKTCIAILCVMLFYYLRSVKEITFATSHDFFTTIRCLLQDSHLEPMQESSAVGRLPSLRSLAFEPASPSSVSNDPLDIAKMVTISSGISDIYLRKLALYSEGFYGRPKAYLRSIVLQDVLVARGPSTFYEFLQSCRDLRRFINVATDNSNQQTWSHPPYPSTIQRVLRVSRRSLRTLCFYCFPIRWLDQDDQIFETFEAFRVLEDLWVDAWSCGWAVTDNVENELDIESESNFEEESVSPPAAVTLIQTLPSSLRRLHIHGPVDRIYNSLRWLAGHCRVGMMPRLKEIAFDDLESKMATEKLKVLFREAGVRTCSVDMDPTSW